MPNYAVELAILTGMRVGELAALKWSCVDDMYIHIDFSEHRLDYSDKPLEYVVGEPKNRKHRVIPVTPAMRDLLKKIEAATPIEKGEYVFVNRKGERCLAKSIGMAAARRCAEAGIQHGSIHRIRRTVSSLLNQDLPQKVVAEMLGHTEAVNEMCYNYSIAETSEKVTALNHLAEIICLSERYLSRYCGTKIYIPNAIQKIRGTVSIDKSGETDNLLKRASQYEDAGDLDKADEYYERVLDIDADNETAHQKRPLIQIRKARVFERQGNIPLAEQILGRAIRLYPANEAVRSELQRITHTIYAPNVTIINRTKDKKTIFELLENGSKNKVVDLSKTENSQATLSFPIGRHTINAGKSSNNFEFSIDSNKTVVVIVLEPKMFGCVIKQTDKIIAPVMKKDPNRLYCPKCGSDDISVQIVEEGTLVKEGMKVHRNSGRKYPKEMIIKSY